MADLNSTLSRLLTALSISDPTWDVSVGSATYKILESVAQELSNTANNSTLLSYGYDINSKYGTELDAFVNLFGITRYLGSRATGSVVFSTATKAVQDYTIPLGTQVYAPSSTYSINVTYTTTSTAVISSGQSSIQVPIIAVLPGSFANLPAGAITQIGSPLVGVTSVTNENSLVNGQDAETDSQLKQRFFNTSFSNFSGTPAKFNSIARQNPSVTRSALLEVQQDYSEALVVNTLISGNSNFKLGLNVQATLSGTSGSTTASGLYGQLMPNYNITVSSTTSAGLYTGSVNYDGVNYNLTGTAPTGNCLLNINYNATEASPTTLSGSSTAANVVTVLSGILNSVLGYNNAVVVTASGSTVAGGIVVSFSQGIPWNVVRSSGTGVVVSGFISSLIPDSKYSYPQGGEYVGLNLNTPNQILLNNGTDYNYLRPSGNAPLTLQVSFNPLPTNSPYVYTGHSLQLLSQYIPLASRNTISGGNTITTSNCIDLYVDDVNTSSINEQVIVTSNTITASGSGIYSLDKFIVASGATPLQGNYYISLSQGPVANFPYQLLSGSEPSYMTFGKYRFPISLNPIISPVSIASISGTTGNNYVTTSTSISGLIVGLVASGITSTTVPVGSNASLSGLGTGNYITQLVPGNPNTIYLANNLTNSISGTVGWVSVAYPVYDNTNTAGSILDITGVCISGGDPTGAYGTDWPAVNSVGTLAHNFYSDVQSIDDLVQQSRTVGINALVHAPQYLLLKINLSIVYNQNANVNSVNSSIQTALSQYLNSVSFGSVVSLSTIVQTVYNVGGVWSARITTSSDNSTNYGVQAVNLDGTNKGTAYTKDIILNANQIPYLYTANLNSFGFSNF